MFPISLLDKIATFIYSSSLKYNKLLSIIDHEKDRILQIKPTAANCISNLHPRGMIEGCIKEETWRIKAHLFMRKINEEEKKFVEEVGHVIVDYAIFHWS